MLLVHRPRYDDWTLPKGKLEPGESWEAAALREVEEEAGLRCELGAFVGSTRYEHRGRSKEVRWWAMTAAGDAVAGSEADAVRWATPEEAESLLAYPGERELLRAAGIV